MRTTYSWRPGSRIKRKVDRRAMNRLIRRSAELAGLPVERDFVLSVRFISDPAMARANADFVGHEGTTDVITFSYLDDPDAVFAGDVAVELLIGAEVAEREGAARPDSSFEAELALYVAHGFLHAAGEDDLSPGPRRRMRRREAEVMAALAAEMDFAAIWAPATL